MRNCFWEKKWQKTIAKTRICNYFLSNTHFFIALWKNPLVTLLKKGLIPCPSLYGDGKKNQNLFLYWLFIEIPIVSPIDISIIYKGARSFINDQLDFYRTASLSQSMELKQINTTRWRLKYWFLLNQVDVWHGMNCIKIDHATVTFHSFGGWYTEKHFFVPLNENKLNIFK